MNAINLEAEIAGRGHIYDYNWDGVMIGQFVDDIDGEAQTDRIG